MKFGFKIRRVACSVLAATALSAVNSFAVTSQFRGVNWADKRDNFVSDILVLSGMSLSDNYQSASVVADRVIGQFQELFGTNSVRIPVNEPTILKFWDTYTGVIDMGLSKGRIVMGYWGPAQPSGPKNMNDWWSMWAKIVEKYGDHPNAYFEIFNEPHMYSKTELRDLYAQWLSKFPNVPRDHILLDGSGLAWNVPDIADDPRFEGCLFAVHEYTFWNMSITTEQGWKNSFKGKVGKYIDRTVCTEWGGAMSPGDKAGVHYDYMDYNSTPTNYFMAYIRGMSDQLREWEMGSFYWPGLRDGDWYSMTKRSGEGANIKLEIVNQSGVDRMKMAWADTVETTPLVREAFSGEPAAIPGVIEAENYDKGGNRFSFYDKDATNKGEIYREDAVDVVTLDGATCNGDACKGYAIGYTEAGEWLEYSVKVAADGKYGVRANVATASETSKIQLLVDGKVLLDTVTIDKVDTTWNVYKEIDIGAANLTAGEHILRLVIAGSYVNVDWLEFCEKETCEDKTGIRAIAPAAVSKAAPRLRKQGGKLFVEKNGMRFDLTGHRIK
ncbi:Cellulase (glycosyl hydrolase family 5) [Fibrobacter sp. UWOV1]|uniref:carbohydrate-binding protein n=1 Tax=Fibrobacter sp. UWOV1 TaxID=1896215 RepID=UPI00091DB396|nr:cellulase family glycosylhydrolase [Fibrobacter sp. UWOV1]SHK69932.1 Cellulase (glycosyl hydrolase family 5) [Fibrobacter sp. UWOV1]